MGKSQHQIYGKGLKCIPLKAKPEGSDNAGYRQLGTDYAILKRADNLMAFLGEEFSCYGQSNRTLGLDKQLQVKFLLQGRDGLARGRLSDVKLTGGAGKV